MTPYPIKKLDGLMRACVSFAEHHESSFWAGDIAGMDGVSSDIPSLERMIDWVAETDKELLKPWGFGKDNVASFRGGRNAKRIMNHGGFKEYLTNRKIIKQFDRVRTWCITPTRLFRIESKVR